MSEKKSIIIGISGRQSSGKSTISKYLTSKKTYLYTEIEDPLDYISEIIYSKISLKKKEKIYQLLIFYFGKDFKFPKKNYRVDISTVFSESFQYREYREYSFADPLKKIASVIFEFDIPQENVFEILLGEVSEKEF